LNILSFATLFPNAANPHHGVFVENRLRHLAASGRANVRVVAPVPWVPPGLSRVGRYRGLAAAPRRERRSGLDVVHPRYPAIPRLGMTVAPLLMYAWTVGAVRRVIEEGFQFDLIDAHYFYPDGVAAVMLGRHFGRPVTITARGSDLNVIPEHTTARAWILWAARRAARVITVSEALGERAATVGIERAKIAVLRNGVDLAAFRPLPGKSVRRKLGLDGTVLICVGNVLEAKGQRIAVGALPLLPGAALMVVGEGPDRPTVEATAARLGVDQRVHFVGRVRHADLAEWYSAADVLVLPSSREGWPNVLLEAMACGTPAVATRVGGIPEVIAAPEAGRLMDQRTPEALARAVEAVLAARPDRAATRTYAEKFGWDETTQGQLALFEEILARPTAARPALLRAL